MTAKAVVRSMRLRTLPLSTAGVVLGIMLACADYTVPWYTIVLIILTTISLQILSNMSNELGDWLSGVDSDKREGPVYSLGEGGLTTDQMRSCIRIMMLVCCILGLGMIRASFGTVFRIESQILIILGGFAIWAAMNYTLGNRPYGYKGLGDLFVFIFFGLVSVMGSYFVASHSFNWSILMPGTAIGFFSVGVLNVNNIRDMESDADSRVTIPLKLGERRAKIYHTLLIVLGWSLMLIFTFFNSTGLLPYLYVITLPLYIIHLTGVWKFSGKELDPMLPLLVMSTFLLALLVGAGFILQ
ncbi:MAG: 1,4-dihydroxy-2-naphthoate octaprenyltransferase [Bacteroidaceae bacterium]|jgi:1,4-dihydroxy-2-naphthoate octaprenyltransferase|nr:1,4-dihydroxy-2-naphthoate octaprenyltransferase [Bacteroidales bacterium]HBA12937.1 1,4-dihydroxy-2-naphthoate octaprenyltransferase [Bacteroidales bacterium]